VNDEDWPTLDSVVAFRDAVRRRLANLYYDLATGKRTLTRNIARTLVMTHEHEGFHIEVSDFFKFLYYFYVSDAPSVDTVVHAYSESWDWYSSSPWFYNSAMGRFDMSMVYDPTSIYTNSYCRPCYSRVGPS
jgi:hypothetical protein